MGKMFGWFGKLADQFAQYAHSTMPYEKQANCSKLLRSTVHWPVGWVLAVLIERRFKFRYLHPYVL